MARYADELATACRSARAAGEAIRRRYEAGGAPERAKDDGSPVTSADLEANELIVELLRAAYPDDGILSEEGGTTADRLGRSRVWIVDPLDGTRDFVGRTGDFSVHVGLAVDGHPVVGAVYQPVPDRLFRAVAGEGADENGEPLRVSKADDLDRLALATTRFAPNPKLSAFLERAWAPRSVARIGASVKAMAVASGAIEVALWLTDTEKEWDTCAPEVIVREAGGAVTDLDGAALRYNQPDVRRRRGVLYSNGPNHTALLALARPYFDA